MNIVGVLCHVLIFDFNFINLVNAFVHYFTCEVTRLWHQFWFAHSHALLYLTGDRDWSNIANCSAVYFDRNLSGRAGNHSVILLLSSWLPYQVNWVHHTGGS